MKATTPEKSAHKAEIIAALSRLSGDILRTTDQPGVFRVRRPWYKIWSNRRDSAGRPLFIDAVRKHLPYVLIWLPVPDTGTAEMFATPLHSKNDIGLWQWPANQTTAAILDALHQGGWAMFFYREPVLAPIDVPKTLATELPALMAQFQAMDATAAIYSWYDDNEWHIAIEP